MSNCKLHRLACAFIGAQGTIRHEVMAANVKVDLSSTYLGLADEFLVKILTNYGKCQSQLILFILLKQSNWPVRKV